MMGRYLEELRFAFQGNDFVCLWPPELFFSYPAGKEMKTYVLVNFTSWV
jgi:hypothetical protein